MPVAYVWDMASAVSLIAAPVVLWLTLAVARQRQDRVARALIWFCVGILIWTVAFGFEVAAADVPTLWFWLLIEFIGIMAVGPLWLLVLLRYVDADRWAGAWLLPLLVLPPLACYVLLLTNPWHGLFYSTVEVGHYERGPAFWLNAAIGYSYFAASFVVVIVASMRAPRWQQHRLWLLAVASAVPLLPNIIFVALHLPSRFDPTPLLFAISGAIMVELLTRGRLLQARPVALRTALAVASDAIIVADVDGRIIETNGAARLLLGNPPVDRLEPVLAAIGATPAERNRLTLLAPQTCLLRGADRVIEAQTMPVLEDQRKAGLVAWLRDVTERERLIEQLRAARSDLEERVMQRTIELEEARTRADVRAAELAATLEAIPDGIILTDDTGLPRLTNQAASLLLAMPLRSGQPLAEQVAARGTVVEGDGPTAITALRCLLTDPDADPVELAIRADGAVLHLRLTAAPVRDAGGQPYGMVVAIHDQTQQRQWERARRDFLAMAAHELRTPATGIVLATQLLQRRLADWPAPQRAASSETLAALQRQSRRLNSLVNDLLDSARLDGGFLVVEPATIDLAALARHVVADLAAKLPSVVVDAPDEVVLVLADPTRAEQIIGNLIDNARKYSPDGQPVTLAITTDARMGCLAVIDQGIGIPAADLPHVFERFYRAGNAVTSSGTGLGLALSRELARRMGGDVTATSVEGHGSTFTMSLPRPL